jgi:hypothetical protein
MSDAKYDFGGVPTILVKGGTTSSSYDKEMALRRADAERRRAFQDAQAAVARNNGLSREGFSIARLGSARMITQETPRLVLYYMNADKTVRQECKSEITFYEDPTRPGAMDMMFAMVCPRCLERGIAEGESQMLIRSSHRKFWIDERLKGSVVALRDPWGNPDPVIICGTVTVQDVVRCSNHNCNYAVRIQDSKVYEV